jgi:hypothetical protein
MNTLAVDFKQLDVATELVLTFPSVTTSTKMGYPNYQPAVVNLTAVQTINLTADYQRQISGMLGGLSETGAQAGLIYWLPSHSLVNQPKPLSRLRRID